MYTDDLIIEYINMYFSNKYNKVAILEYELQNNIINVDFSSKKDEKDITDLDIKYNTDIILNNVKIDLLEYITFIFNYKQKQ